MITSTDSKRGQAWMGILGTIESFSRGDDAAEPAPSASISAVRLHFAQVLSFLHTYMVKVIDALVKEGSSQWRWCL
jgi:hypothetical protein